MLRLHALPSSLICQYLYFEHVCVYSYESMRDLCNRYNEVIADCGQLVIFLMLLLHFFVERSCGVY